jgi:hypothetical protein
MPQVSVEPSKLSYNLTQGRLCQPFARGAVTTVTWDAQYYS